MWCQKDSVAIEVETDYASKPTLGGNFRETVHPHSRERSYSLGQLTVNQVALAKGG